MMVIRWTTIRALSVMTNLACVGATMVLWLSVFINAAPAQTRTWDGGGADSEWSTSGNWSSNNVPNNDGEAALFTNDPIGQTKLTPNLPDHEVIGQLQYSSTAPSYTITGTGPATLFLSPADSYGGVGVVVASGAADQSITAAEVEFLSSQTWDIGGTTTLLVTGTIEDDSVIDYGLTKTGTGTLVFPGDVRYDGPTFVEAGALILSYSNTSMLSALTVNDGLLRATSDANALGNHMSRNTITMAGGELELANDTDLMFGHANRNTVIDGDATIRSDRLTAGAGVILTLGGLRIGARTLTVEPGVFVNSGTAGITFGATTLTDNGATFDVASGAGLTLGALAGNFSFAKRGAGQLTLTSATSGNRTSAEVTLEGGRMTLQNASALGTSDVPVSLLGGVLELASNTSVNAHNTSVGGNATIVSNRSSNGNGVNHSLGALAVGAHTLSLQAGDNVTGGTARVTFGATTLSGDITFDVVNNQDAITRLTLGSITETGGARSLTKSGDGSLTLSAGIGYTGDTSVLAGTLSLSNSGLEDSADVYLSTGSTLELLFSGDPDVIDGLFIDGMSQPVGTWGSMSSMATNKSDLFAGTGLLFVSTTVAPPILIGDYNDDGEVNAADYTVWRNALGQSDTLLNRDPLNVGLINADDYVAWKDHYGEMSPAEGAHLDLMSVPEPSSSLLMIAAVVVGWISIRRKPQRRIA